MSPVTRRRALCLLPAAGAALAAPVAAMAAIPAVDMPAKATIGETLIAYHRWKVNAANAAYSAFGDLEERHPLPQPEVRYGVSKRDGGDVPLYAYSEADLDNKLSAHERVVDLFPGGRERFATRKERLVQELRRQFAANAEAEAATGIAAARAACDEAAEGERHAVRCLTGAKYATHAELLAVMAYMLEGRNEPAMLFDEADFVTLSRSQTGVGEA